MSLLWKVASTPEVPDSVEHYMSGGIGHLEGDDSRSVVGMVPVKTLEKYREHNGTWEKTYGGEGLAHDAERRRIESIKDDIRNGSGIKTPLMLDYDHKNQWGSLGEGNHRLRAAAEMGLSHVPVRIYGRADLEDNKSEGTGAPLSMTTHFKGGMGERYIPPAIHPHHFEALKP
jgi:hypothetical protein